MALSLSSSPLMSTTNKPAVISDRLRSGRVSWMADTTYSSKSAAIKVNATEKEKPTTPKTNSILCPDCEGNGAKRCGQCQGTGINSVDHFNGQFKAGSSCWLCRGKREVLCGNCNGAGFLGGFLSAFED